MSRLGLARRLGFQALSLEDPAQPLLPPSALFESLGLGRSDAGVLINEHQVMRLATAHACVKVISEDLSSTAHEIFQKMPDDEMRLAEDHRLWSILHDEPNPNMSAMTFWGAFLASAVGWGNGYAWIKRDRSARVTALIPLMSGRTSPVKLNGQLMYATTQTDSGGVAYIDPANMLHVMGVSFDGITGMGPVMCMNAYGLAAAAEKFGAQFFGNGARATGVLTHPGVLDDEPYEHLKKSVREWATGDNALRPVILEDGMTWQQTTIAPNEAQFLQTRRYQRTEIAALYRVPLHMIGDLERATFSNIEQQSLDYVRYCLRPWAVRIEQEVNRKLLGPPFCMEHKFDDLQRGDFKTQTEGYQVLRNIGVYSTNNVLRKLREPQLSEEDGGDVRTVQGAMIPLTALVGVEDELLPTGAPTDPAAAPQLPAPPSARGRQMAKVYRRVFRDAVGRILNRAGDTEFAKRALHPAVSSMAQAMLSQRYGNGDLMHREIKMIADVVADMAEGSKSWQKNDASGIATRVTELAYAALAKEILE